MAGQDMIFVGIRGTVLALDSSTGTETWKTALKGMDFVNVTLLGGTVYAATKGEMFALAPESGHIIWHNKLRGLGFGFVTIAGSSQGTVAMRAQRKQQAQVAAGAAAGAAAST